MNRHQAVQEARKRWGRQGDAQRRSDTNRKLRFVVGVLMSEPYTNADVFSVRGAGDSFEAAIEDADRRAALELLKETVPPVALPKLSHLWSLATARAQADLTEKKSNP